MEIYLTYVRYFFIFKQGFIYKTPFSYKLNFIIDPFVKFKCSISIESMSHQLDVNHVHLNHNNDIKSFENITNFSNNEELDDYYSNFYN